MIEDIISLIRSNYLFHANVYEIIEKYISIYFSAQNIQPFMGFSPSIISELFRRFFSEEMMPVTYDLKTVYPVFKIEVDDSYETSGGVSA